MCRIRDHIVIEHRLAYDELNTFECDKILNGFVNSKSKQRSLEQIKKGDRNYCLLTWIFFKHHVCKIHDYLINMTKGIDGSVMQVFTQPAFTCSKLTIETLEQGVKYVQS